MARNSDGIEKIEADWKSSPTQTLCARLADLLRQAGRSDEAVEVATEGLRKWSNSTSIRIVLGRCYRDAGRLDESIDVFSTVLEQQPLNLVALRNIAELTYEKRRWPEAVKYLEEYLFEDSTDQRMTDMLEEARTCCRNMDPVEDAQDEDEPLPDEQSQVTEEEPSFPDTDRMNRVLSEQGLEVSSEGSTVPGDEVPSDHGIGRDIPPQAASLLDVFSAEERDELDLKPFEGEIE